MKKTTTLYLGTNPTFYECEGHLIHYPVIKIVPKDPHSSEISDVFGKLEEFTHLIFTSKNAARIFFANLKELKIDKSILEKKCLIAIGPVTAIHLEREGFTPKIIAEEETQEGVIEELKKENLKDAFVFLPRSSISRPALLQHLQESNIRHVPCDLYDTVTQKREFIPELQAVDEIVFTSPSTVKGFVEIFGKIPKDKKLKALGPITEEAIRKAFH
jgi:uroporphyrinogen-III synthase